MNIIEKLFHRKTKLAKRKLYYLDHDGIYHFDADCIVNTLGGKFISNHGSIKYRLCLVCSSRHAIKVHEHYIDIRDHSEEWIAQLAVKVAAADMPPEKKEEAMMCGVLQIRVMESLFGLMDSFNEINNDKSEGGD